MISFNKNKKILSRNPENLSETRHIPTVKKPYILLQYPLDPEHETYCSQGNANLEGSHSHDNILYAIDFLTPPNKEAGIIRSAHEGTAYVYDKCEFRKNDYNSL
ncbi:hypothetical protein NOVO_05515 [Rickettsiales bacterium Ac37b]|nr:hypothetical protein NOVO_04725 [Rickettsiales bacterium Ac37b]AIL65472.1 hypothetical protein NOVO_05515 [Rickettsiales bacterium Ac37b]